ncbi:MAG: TraB/GumN family protein [Thermodesulfobacteriota bacterium]
MDGNHSDVHEVCLPDGRAIILVGTAHISRASRDLVRRVIERELPDRVCVELDGRRHDALTQPQRWENLNLRELIRSKQLSTLLVNLVLASYQKKLGDQLGMMPGAELLEAVETARGHDIPVALCDRDIRVTLRRAWHAVPFWKKSYLLSLLMASLFDREEISEEKLAQLRQSDALSELMAEVGRAMPELQRALIAERDIYLAERIKQAAGRRIVAVVGAGHVAGIRRALLGDHAGEMEEIDRIPPASGWWKAAGWLIPLAIIASLAWIGYDKGGAVAGSNVLFWILANGVPSALGAILALAHPLTVAGAFAAAPVTSLTPVIGAGYVTAFIQAMLRPPLVAEFHNVLDDMGTLGGWWRNRLLKVFLAFLLPGVGSMIGTWVGGYEIFRNVF